MKVLDSVPILPLNTEKETANSVYVRCFDRTLEGERIQLEDFSQICAHSLMTSTRSVFSLISLLGHNQAAPHTPLESQCIACATDVPVRAEDLIGPVQLQIRLSLSLLRFLRLHACRR